MSKKEREVGAGRGEREGEKEGEKKRKTDYLMGLMTLKVLQSQKRLRMY